MYHSSSHVWLHHNQCMVGGGLNQHSLVWRLPVVGSWSLAPGCSGCLCSCSMPQLELERAAQPACMDQHTQTGTVHKTHATQTREHKGTRKVLYKTIRWPPALNKSQQAVLPMGQVWQHARVWSYNIWNAAYSIVRRTSTQYILW